MGMEPITRHSSNNFVKYVDKYFFIPLSPYLYNTFIVTPYIFVVTLYGMPPRKQPEGGMLINL